MSNAIDQSLKQALEHGLRALGEERELIRRRLEQESTPPARWAELELRAGIAELVGRRPSPASRRTVEGTLAAVRAFREALVLH